MSMDAVKFFSERRRMHKFYKSCGDGCPLRDYNCCCIQDFGAAEVKAVEKWSQEHPRKVRQSKFLDMFPAAGMDGVGVLDVCPAIVDDGYKDGHCGNRTPFSCQDCRREFWMQEV